MSTGSNGSDEVTATASLSGLSLGAKKTGGLGAKKGGLGGKKSGGLGGKKSGGLGGKSGGLGGGKKSGGLGGGKKVDKAAFEASASSAEAAAEAAIKNADSEAGVSDSVTLSTRLAYKDREMSKMDDVSAVVPFMPRCSLVIIPCAPPCPPASLPPPLAFDRLVMPVRHL